MNGIRSFARLLRGVDHNGDRVFRLSDVRIPELDSFPLNARSILTHALPVAHWLFDLDGTLVDSKAATIEAYKEAGHTFDPSNWGKSASGWRCPEDVHARKQAAWANHVGSVTRGIAFDLYQAIPGYGRHILTGASLPTASLTLPHAHNYLGLGYPRTTHVDMSFSEKAECLRWHVRDGRYRIVYVDDSLDILRRMSAAVNDPLVVFVHAE